MARLFRREPLHEQLAREGGLVPPDPRPAWQETGIHGMQRPREWDATFTVDVPGIEGNAVRWVTLPDGSLLVEHGPEGSLAPLADAVDQRVPPPYRARASRQVDDVWAVQAARIEVLELPDAPEGDTVDVARNGETTTLAVDGLPVFGSLPALEARGERESANYAVHAEHLDGVFWEVRAAAL